MDATPLCAGPLHLSVDATGFEIRAYPTVVSTDQNPNPTNPRGREIGSVPLRFLCLKQVVKGCQIWDNLYGNHCMVPGEWPKNEENRFCTVSPVSTVFPLLCLLFLFFGRLFHIFFALFACCHVAAAI